jgi:hypothetical protein
MALVICGNDASGDLLQTDECRLNIGLIARKTPANNRSPKSREEPANQ